jgi:hypothetical protein
MSSGGLVVPAVTTPIRTFIEEGDCIDLNSDDWLGHQCGCCDRLRIGLLRIRHGRKPA